jgi:peptide/nickel transport system substrate-binding protein
MKVEQFIPGSRVVLTRNDNYWKEGRPYIDRFESIIGLDRSGQIAALAARQSDYMIITDRAQFATVHAAVPDVTYYEYAPGYNYGFRLKVDQAPYDDVRVRRAFNMAIDRDEMRNTMAQGGGVLNSVAAPGFRTGWGLPESELRKLPGWRLPKDQDLQEARRLLAEAGYPNGFRTKISYDQTNSFYPYVTEVAAGQLRRVGIQADGNPLETAVASKNVREGVFDVITSGSVSEANPDNALRGNFRSNGINAIAAGLKDTKLDEMIDRQTVELDEAKRKQIFLEIDRYLIDQAYHITTVSGSYFGAWQPYVNGVYPAFSGQPWLYRTDELWIDHSRAPADRRTR